MEHIGMLLIKLSKSHKAYLATQLAALDLYPGQDGLIYYLSKSDGQTMSELVEQLQVQHPTVFTMVARMEKAGLVGKKKDNADKRTSRVYLTKKGKEVSTQLSTIWVAAEKKLSDGFTPDQKEQAMALLKKLIDNCK